MKKVLFFSIIVFSITGFLRAQDIVNPRLDVSDQNLRGPVASLDEDVLVRKEYFRDDWPGRKWFRDNLRECLMEENGHVYTFNPAGRMLSHTYTLRGVEKRTTTCSYNANGVMTSFLGEGYKAEGTYIHPNVTYKVYAESKSYSGVDVARGDLKNAKYTNTYAFDMHCAQELDDSYGKVMSSTYTYVDNTPAYTYTYSYGLGGRIEEVVEKDFSAGETKTTKFKYDNKGHLQQMSVKGRSYDDTYTYENNQQGDPVKLTIQTPYSKVVYTYEYEYDEYDNWTLCLQYKDAEFEKAVLHHLSYHKAAPTKASIAAQKEAEAQVKAEAKEQKAAESRLVKAEKNSEKAKESKGVSLKSEKKDKASKGKTEKTSDKKDKASKDKAEKKSDNKGKSVKKDGKNVPDEISDKANTPKKAKADKSSKDKKAKADKSTKDKKAKADKSSKDKKAKADKSTKDKGVSTGDSDNAAENPKGGSKKPKNK